MGEGGGEDVEVWGEEGGSGGVEALFVEEGEVQGGVVEEEEGEVSVSDVGEFAVREEDVGDGAPGAEPFSVVFVSGLSEPVELRFGHDGSEAGGVEDGVALRALDHGGVEGVVVAGGVADVAGG